MRIQRRETVSPPFSVQFSLAVQQSPPVHQGRSLGNVSARLALRGEKWFAQRATTPSAHVEHYSS